MQSLVVVFAGRFDGRMMRNWQLLVIAAALAGWMHFGGAREAIGNGEKLYGVHWWDFDSPTVGSGPTNGSSV